MRWWRAYDEMLDDPKVQDLPAQLFKRYINLLHLANRGTPRGFLPDVRGIAFALRIRQADAEGTVSALRQAGLLDEEEGRLVPHGWTKRQPESDDSLPRVRRLRYGHGLSTVTVTPQRRGEEKRVEEKRVEVLHDDDGFVVPDHLLALWRKTYPALDVPLAVRAAFAWTVANPQNRKSNWTRFVTNWLKREQDHAPRAPAPPPPPPRAAIQDLPDLPPGEAAANIRRVGEMARGVAARRAMP